MSVPKRVAGFTGSVFVSVGILLIVLALFVSQFNAQIEDLDPILDETFETFLEENQEEIRESLVEEDASYEEFFDLCDSGELSDEECDISAENPLIEETFEDQKVELRTQIEEAFAPVISYARFVPLAVVSGVVLFLLGLLLLAIGLKPDWLALGQTVSRKIGWSFLFSFAAVWYVLGLSTVDLEARIAPLADGALDILITFLAVLVKNLLHAVLEPFYFPFLFLGGGGIVFWLGFFITRQVKGRKKEVKKKGKA